MSADHDHDHVHVTAATDRRRLALALAAIAGLTVAEVVAGILAHSLALLSDAAHMLTDAGALLVSLVVIGLVARPPGGNMTYGLKRAEALSAQANGATLLVLALLIVFDGVKRLVSPPDPDGLTMLVVALAGIPVVLFATVQLARANRESLNVEGSFQHLATDLVAFALTAAAGAVVLATGFGRADGIAALVIAAVMLRAAWRLLMASGRVFLEAAPAGMDVAAVGRAIAAHPHVTDVHDLHVWEIGSGFPALSAHVLVHEGDDCHAVRRELEELVRDRFGVEHTTLQVDHERARRLLRIRNAVRG